MLQIDEGGRVTGRFPVNLRLFSLKKRENKKSYLFRSNIQVFTSVHFVCSNNCLSDTQYTCALDLYNQSQTVVLFILCKF